MSADTDTCTAGTAVAHAAMRVERVRLNSCVMPGRCLAVVDDLFFVAKIDATARALGIPCKVVGRFEELEKECAQAPALILLDLNLAGADAVEIIRRLAGSERLRAVPLTAFASHVQTDRIRAAGEAGCANVIPRSELSADLAAILTRHCGG